MGYPDGLNSTTLDRAIGENPAADLLLAESLTKGRKALAALDEILSDARDTAEALEHTPACEDAAAWWRCLIDELCNARLEADRLANGEDTKTKRLADVMAREGVCVVSVGATLASLGLSPAAQDAVYSKALSVLGERAA